MSRHLARDFSIWNMLKYGDGRSPILVEEDRQQQEIKEEKYYDSKESKYYDIEKQPAVMKSQRVPESKTGGILPAIVGSLCGLMVFAYVHEINLFSVMNNIFMDMNCDHNMGIKYSVSAPLQSFVDETNINIAGLSKEPKEIIEVSYPYVPNSDYGKSVYSTILVNHTFGDSWGSPAIVDFTPPSNATYNKVVLTLNTSVDGVQYDRLANLFIDDIEIWRTSTIEPGGSSVFSSFKKDVSTYLKLFQKPGQVLFQLDNILNSRLTGKFNIQLSADFYLASNHSSGSSEEKLDAKYKVFSIMRPANQIYSLTSNKNKLKPSLAYLPSDKLHVNLPSLPQNTTRLKLSIFTSGNAAEEFWYSNVMDEYAYKFGSHGKTLQGHGPLRIVNVYFNGEKIATQTPEPVIFTGGISPALWSSVVSTNAFDLPTIDVDISGLLPYIWENQAIHDRYLEIEVSNGLDEVDGFVRSNIAENWITAANLLTFENDQILNSNGEILKIDDNNSASVVGFAPPFTGSLQQVIKGKFEAELSSNLIFDLKDGSRLNTTIRSYSKAEISNVQSYKNYGDIQSLVHIGHSLKSLTIEDNDQQNKIHQLDTLFSYPLVMNLEEKNKTVNAGNVDIEFDVQLVSVRKSNIKINNEPSLEVSSAQNGTSKYFLSSKGNYGFSKIDTKYKLKVNKPFNEYKYKRKVKTVNGTIISDEVKGGKNHKSGQNILISKESDHDYDSFTSILENYKTLKSFDNEISSNIKDLIDEFSIHLFEFEFDLIDDKEVHKNSIKSKHIKEKKHSKNMKLSKKMKKHHKKIKSFINKQNVKHYYPPTEKKFKNILSSKISRN